MMGERRIIPVTPNKRRAPALYELIGNKDRDPPAPPAAPPFAPPSAAQPPAAPSAAAPAPAPVAPPRPEVARAVPARPDPGRTAPLEQPRPAHVPAHGVPAVTPSIATPRTLEPAPARGPMAHAPNAPASPTRAETEEDDAPDTKVFGITPGSRLNIPVGFAFIAMAVVIAAVLGAYMLGYDKRTKEGRQEQERLAARESGGIVDPTRLPLGDLTPSEPSRPTPGGVPTPTRGGTQAPPANAAPGKEPTVPAAGAGAAPGTPRVIVVKSSKDDPRRDGLNYPTVASLPIKEATAAAEFLVSKGYATALVPSPSDSRLFMVIPMIGVERANYQKASESASKTLRDLGRAFKRDQKGATDFNDLFWKKYER